MKNYLVIFDLYCHEWVGSCSSWILKESFVKANNEKDAIDKKIKKLVKENFPKEDGPHDPDDITLFIRQLRSESISVVEVVKPKVFEVEGPDENK